MKYKLMSLDVFYTLADLGACYRPTWERALGHSVSDAEFAQLNATFNEVYLPLYHALPFTSFRTMEDIFAVGFAHAKETLSLPLDPGEAARIFCEEHDVAPLYPDVKPVLRRLAARCALAVSSDADCSMVEGMLVQLPLRWTFVSEMLRCYKRDQQNRFFSALLRTTGFQPEEILHVGDSAPDILGASACGIHTCLIDRCGNAEKALREKATLYVRSLEELETFLA